MSLIPFWIENWSAGNGSIWVKVPIFLWEALSVFLYYGNASATNVANGYNTFKFFDDFESWIQVTLANS